MGVIGAVTGVPLADGFQTTIMWSLEPTVKFFEIEVQTPSLDAGGKIAITTMRNTRYRTFALKKLIETGDGNLKVSYDPQCLSEILNMIGRNQSVSYSNPDGTVEVWQGGLNSFVRDRLVEGQLPTATINIVHTAVNAAGAETAPTIGTAAPTTTTTTAGP